MQVISRNVNDKYFCVLSFFTRRVDAVWELVRSFILPYTYGAYYRENLLLRLTRVVAIIQPGLSNHTPYDYINATTLAKFSYVSFIDE